jgi:hypothetical protein
VRTLLLGGGFRQLRVDICLLGQHRRRLGVVIGGGFFRALQFIPSRRELHRRKFRRTGLLRTLDLRLRNRDFFIGDRRAGAGSRRDHHRTNRGTLHQLAKFI